MGQTKIIVSNSFSGFRERGYEGVKDESTNCQVRDIFLQRNGPTPHNINKLQNLSNTFPTRIVDENGEVIFELTKKDVKDLNKNFQVFMGLKRVFSIMHSQFYKNIDCAYFFELMNGIENSYSQGGVVNKSKYHIKIIPPVLLENENFLFEVGDILMSTRNSNPKKINSKTLEVENKDFTYTGFHFFVYLGNGYFISKYGDYHKFSIGKLDEILNNYRTTRLFYLEPKQGVQSEYTQRV